MTIAVIDTGTTQMKLVLFDIQGATQFQHAVSTTPRYFDDGRVEQDPQRWHDALAVLLHAAAQYLSAQGLALHALALTSQRSSIIAVDAQGNALSPTLMWQDTRSQALCDSLADASPQVHQRCGLPISPVFSAAKMRWLKQNQTALYHRAAKLVGIHDFLLHRLTGRFCTDYSLASRTNLFNLRTRQWDDSLLALFELDKDKLCTLLPPGSVVGALQPSIAAQVGLPAGIPVISAGGDQQCCALGMGQFASDRVIVNVGTGAYVMGMAATLSTAPLDGHFAYNHAALPGNIVIEGALLSASCAYDWFNRTFYQADGDYHTINQEVSAASPGGYGLVLSPFFKGKLVQQSPGEAKAFFYDIALHHTRGDFARAILEGIAHELHHQIQGIAPLVGEITDIYTAGGITQFGTFNQIQADIYNRPVVALEDNATAAGAWISAVVTLQHYRSYAQAHQQIARHQHTWRFSPQPDNVALYQAQAVKSRTVREHIYS
ncbi:FGGY-family carbohydrate kinase [Candidatus Symbiopectobacterium sp. NZEC151]|uniref:FGGY-family carbohydrate kinase n=3 Tax=unclassified Symbiopectobacterium TaxID=2794573 RepID=UPI002225EDDC|nr:FGGY-family carbohydrate kinase [Candidatus Symbiopectobacterium sp. NZEC151]MCW2473143.1 hypothetical protein [Candidatus Symbiopectobacterium sp. NZEC151]